MSQPKPMPMWYVLFRPGLNRGMEESLVQAIAQTNGAHRGMLLSGVLIHLKQMFSMSSPVLFVCSEERIKHTGRELVAIPFVLLASEKATRDWTIVALENLFVTYGGEVLWDEFAARFQSRFYAPAPAAITATQAHERGIIGDEVNPRSGLVFVL